MQTTVQELEVWYILPAVRKEIARVMKDKGLTQARIARHLKITEAAVSQYVKSKRAVDVRFEERMRKEIERAAENIMAGKSQRMEIQKLMQFSQKHHYVCKVCPDFKGHCKECYEGN